MTDSVEVGEQLKPKKIDKLIAGFEAVAGEGEELRAIYSLNNVRPTMDALLITSARVAGVFSAEANTEKAWRRVVNGADIAQVDSEKTRTTHKLTITTTNGETHRYPMIRDEEIEAVRARVEAIKGAPVPVLKPDAPAGGRDGELSRAARRSSKRERKQHEKIVRQLETRIQNTERGSLLGSAALGFMSKVEVYETCVVTPNGTIPLAPGVSASVEVEGQIQTEQGWVFRSDVDNRDAHITISGTDQVLVLTKRFSGRSYGGKSSFGATTDLRRVAELINQAADKGPTAATRGKAEAAEVRQELAAQLAAAEKQWGEGAVKTRTGMGPSERRDVVLTALPQGKDLKKVERLLRHWTSDELSTPMTVTEDILLKHAETLKAKLEKRGAKAELRGPAERTD